MTPRSATSALAPGSSLATASGSTPRWDRKAAGSTPLRDATPLPVSLPGSYTVPNEQTRQPDVISGGAQGRRSFRAAHVAVVQGPSFEDLDPPRQRSYFEMLNFFRKRSMRPAV